LTNYIINNANNEIYSQNDDKDLKFTQEYITSLNLNLIEKKNYSKTISNPKISIIVSVYNKEKYLNRLIISIQNQLLEEFELIIVDDFSNDSSVKIIENFQIIDKRIKLIINKKNCGSLYTRYIGSTFANGKYFLLADSDDIILRYGLQKVYSYIYKNFLDIVEFTSIFQINDSLFVNRYHYIYKNIIYKPFLPYVFYYNISDGFEWNQALWNKLIKNQVVKKSFKYIGEDYLKKNIKIENDVILLFSIFQNARSYHYLDEIGYYYFGFNNNSITNSYGPHNANEIIYSIFNNINFLFEKLNNPFLDKSLCIYKLKQGFFRYKILFNYLTKGFSDIFQILDNIKSSNYISQENKDFIDMIKSYILIT
jgi:glycosyltransferase involved in cell wall biosynthesis